jgi:SH3-like domain-containing protein
MKGFHLRHALVAAALASVVTALPGAASAQAQTAAQEAGRGASGLPLPRFVSLKSGRVNSRIGPGVNYAVDWMYLKSGMPMEIIQEYDNWRRVRDADGAEGWVNQSLLSGRRTAIVAPWQRGKETVIPVMKEPSREAAVVAQVEPGVIGTIKTCNGEWCEMNFDGHEGWMSQALLWGAYPGETVKD